MPLQPGQIDTEMLFRKISTTRYQDWHLNKVTYLLLMNCQTT